MLKFQNIRGNSCHKVSFFLLREKIQGQGCGLIIQLISQILQDTIPEKSDEKHGQIVKYVFQKKQADDDPNHKEQCLFTILIHVLGDFVIKKTFEIIFDLANPLVGWRDSRFGSSSKEDLHHGNHRYIGQCTKKGIEYIEEYIQKCKPLVGYPKPKYFKKIIHLKSYSFDDGRYLLIQSKFRCIPLFVFIKSIIYAKIEFNFGFGTTRSYGNLRIIFQRKD